MHGKEQMTSLIDVYDVAKGIIALINISSDKWKKEYNLGTGKVNTVYEVAEITNVVAEKVFNIKAAPIIIVAREIVPFSAMDISRIREDTGWEPEVSIAKMIENMFRKSFT